MIMYFMVLSFSGGAACSVRFSAAPLARDVEATGPVRTSIGELVATWHTLRAFGPRPGRLGRLGPCQRAAHRHLEWRTLGCVRSRRRPLRGGSTLGALFVGLLFFAGVRAKRPAAAEASPCVWVAPWPAADHVVWRQIRRERRNDERAALRSWAAARVAERRV